MAAGGPLTYLYNEPRQTVEHDFALVGNSKTAQLIDPAQVNANMRQLAGALNEMNDRVAIVKKQFDDVVAIAETAKGMFYQSWNYRPISNLARMATQWYLTPKQHTAIFGQAAIHKAASDLLSDVFTTAMAGLAESTTPDDFCLSLRDLRVALNNLIPLYLSAITNADVLPQEFQKLPEGLQEALDQHLTEQGMPTIGGLKGLAVVGPQHLGRIPLMLKTLAETAMANEHPGIRAEGEQIKKIIAEKIEPTMLKKYSSRP